ncbi:cyanocobalamin reductase / alkylcobalamin dealkylase-like isoform X2 [Eriocheir sinensis]|uniref:cyanocobalamin reductase / alkylcobalamin dealkylase-like isoform X2 n=1 Tax=Eriocheir sinensis TaxID=95602 RepID=UPI0021CA6607|nr:cyanocobalamin reductase / alkylcobalamin dealkylase-like isoform X2 [Eriocheir sinensis]XP_050689324.1 cyanocobalamin reductase / alkylcobalamin dealkylase-like isoform X2 [Eriocheir sinensis]XP_050689335.1 cyanocobalamin reductase / alkylcobalamin dealkylase-like isoform X2 [Eriocheir sinensis]
MSSVTVEELREIEGGLTSLLEPHGFECHPFKIGWYNEQVSKPFVLPYHEDTVAFIIISTPSMFEKAFIPFLASADCLRAKQQDPVDQCMVRHFSAVKSNYPELDIETIHDFETTPNKRPRVLVQTAGHVSGAVRYYQRKDLLADPWSPEKKIYGVCLHPVFGGWFALRGVAIFKTLICPDLQKKLPREILATEQEVAELLRRYNEHWEDWSFRDVITPKERYSEEQKEYFATKPAERLALIEKLVASV